jgi:CheY-like chemotaxis protein
VIGAAEHSLKGCRVLIVEDESLVAMLLEEMLEHLGCEVVATASRFPDALEKASTLSFDAAILDVNLNGQTSFPIADALVRRPTAFILATGYGAGAIPARLVQIPVLQKPFRLADLERALLGALQQSSGRGAAAG